jgi:phosphate transport system substrate-binding protein
MKSNDQIIMNHLTVHILILLFISSIGCVKKVEDMEGPTIGRISIWADTTMKDLVEQEEEIFERQYQYAHLDIHYANEHDMFKAFIDDTVDAIMSNRPLTTEELDYLHSLQSIPRHYVFATGAIAFVVNKHVPDTNYTYEQMVEMFGSKESGALFVIENVKSGLTNEILRLINKDELPEHFYALNSKQQVLEYLDSHDNAIGIIDYSEISDSDNAYTKEVLAQNNLLGITRPLDSLQVGFVKPYQYNLQDRKYPFTRDLYFISKTGKNDVALGFATFLCAEIGQKIILKAGLLPKYQTLRSIELNYTNDIKVIK